MRITEGETNRESEKIPKNVKRNENRNESVALNSFCYYFTEIFRKEETTIRSDLHFLFVEQ